MCIYHNHLKSRARRIAFGLVTGLLVMLAGCQSDATPSPAASTAEVVEVTRVVVVIVTREPELEPTSTPTATEEPLPAPTATPTATPQPPPATATATPVPVPTSTHTPQPPPATATVTPVPVPTSTHTPQPVDTPIPAPTIAVVSKARVRIERCNSSLDRRLGHVKDAWVDIQNEGNVALTNVQLTLDADDRDRGKHKDEVKRIPWLAPGKRWNKKMTVDTKSDDPTNLYVTAVSDQGELARVKYWCDQ